MIGIPGSRPIVRITEATDLDLPAILALNQANVPHVGDIDATKLARLHGEAFALRVAWVGGEGGGGGADRRIGGFLLAMTEAAAYESPNFRWFVARHPRFTYVDRIAVADGWRGHGIGRALYADVEALARRRDGGGGGRSGGGGGGGGGGAADDASGVHVAVDWITCEVNLAPPNPGSMAFHERLGFVGVGERWDEGGGTGVRMMAKGLR